MSGNLKYDVRATHGNAMTALLRERIPAGVKVRGGGEHARRRGEDAAGGVAAGAGVRCRRRCWSWLHGDPERFATVAALVEAAGFDWFGRAGCGGRAGDDLGQGGVVLLDTIGDLASVYSLGTLAFVGGSLVTAGGHNPLEPARFGVPVVMGRSSENFREIVKAMRGGGAITRCDSSGLAGMVIGRC